MKTIRILTVLAIAIYLTGCGSSKKVTAPKKRVKVEREECEKKSLEKSEFLRGYGIGTAVDKMFARDIASTNARNSIVNQVQSSVSNMVETYNQQHKVAGTEGINRNEVGKVEATVRSLAEETLKGARIICTNTYMVGNQHEVHVCIELTGEDFAQKMHNKLTSDEKLMIDYEAEKFKEDFNKALEEYRNRK